MAILARIRHETVLGVEAYVYFEDEKYLVHDYCHHPNVDSLLHDKTEGELRPLDWDTRLRIAIGAARGLAHIHNQCRGKLVHGNIKASNIFLNAQQYGCVSDLCFAATDTPVIKYTNYHAPEVKILQKPSQASDVYSYGILLLELLTRNSTVHARIGNEVVSLDTWVNYVTSDKGTIEVFDGELMKPPTFKEEMMKVLLIGMHCVARKPELRPKMADILKMLESIRKNRSDQALNRYINREHRQSDFSLKKDYGRQETESKWVNAHRTSHEIETTRRTEFLRYEETSQMPEEFKRRAKIARLKEETTLKGHIESLVKRRGLDIELIPQNYTI